MAAGDILSLVTKATIESAYLPPIVIDKPFAPGGEPNPLLKALRPRITVELASGSIAPVVIAPYGDPGPSKWPMVRTGLLIGGAITLGLILRHLARRRRARLR